MSIRNNLLCLFVLLCVPFSAGAQSYERIVGDPSYLTGEGTGQTYKEADDSALSQIIEQISVAVTSDLTVSQNRQREGKKQEVSSTFESTVNTYSQATLTMCHRMVLKNGPKEYRILRYISYEELDRMFQGRKDKIYEMLAVASKAESELKIGDALRYYYWSSLLVSTLPYPNELTVMSDDGREVRASVWIPNRINSILDGISVKFGGYDSPGRIIGKLVFLYNGRPVTNLEYTYWDGMDWSMVCSAKDGFGAVEFRAGTSVRSIDVKIEYSYENEAHMDQDVEPVVTSVPPVVYQDAYHYDVAVSDRNRPEIRKAIAPVEQQQVNTGALFDETAASIGNIDTYRVYRKSAEKICDAIDAGSYGSVKPLFDDDGYDVFMGLVAYGNARILDRSHLEFLKFQDQVYCRSVKMNFRFPDNDKEFVEDIVLTFDAATGKITNLSFGLEAVSVTDIMEKTRWGDEAKLVLIDFLETYKTAFALKRLDYISSIFSDDALIITGRVVRKTVIENRMIGDGEFVVYNRQTKDEYIRNLAASFSAKDFINIRFANTDVLKMGKGEEIYGIQIRQDYVSSNYGDTGYLFLLVDVKDPEKPVIHVRTWQPEPDPEFGLYGPGNF